jgi:hypothetical protein
MSPLIMYVVFALLIEALQYHHRRKTRKMYETWALIEKSRERSDLKALFQLLLKEQNIDNDKKILGSKWIETLQA